MLFAAYLPAFIQFGCQQTPEVRPDPLWWDARVLFHWVLLSLLIVATATDLREYIIPVEVTLFGTLFALFAAAASGQLQIIHLWVDWNVPDVELIGQYIPAWIDRYRHWHGLAWSLAGLTAGGGITWLARLVSSLVLRQESLGFGDVMLMGMIGSFVGWQPVVMVFVLAPFLGMLSGIGLKLLFNKPFIPYGPFLAAATVVVLFSWRWLWLWEPLPGLALRRLFGDAQSLLIVAGFSIVALAVMLGLLRLYRLIPGKRR